MTKSLTASVLYSQNRKFYGTRYTLEDHLRYFDRSNTRNISLLSLLHSQTLTYLSHFHHLSKIIRSIISYVTDLQQIISPTDLDSPS